MGQAAVFEIDSDINCANADGLITGFRQVIKDAGGNDIRVVFDTVTSFDSVLVALMVNWIRESQEQNLSIIFEGVTEPMISLMNVYGVKEIISMASEMDIG